MATRTLRIHRLSLAIGIACCVVGCAGKPAQKPQAWHADTARTPVVSENPAAVPHPCPPQPTGPQVGRSDPLLNSARPILAEWSAMWARALPDFAVDSLWRVGTDRWAAMYVRPFEPVKPGPGVDVEDYLAFELLGIRSPDRRYTLDVDDYQAVVPMGDSIEVGGEPDSQCSLIDDRQRLEAMLHQCGTGCGFHWGAWLSPSSFALGGWSEADDYGEWQQGHLWLYSLADSSVTEYVTRIVPADTFERYKDAWLSWLLGRYRAWKRVHPPT